MTLLISSDMHFSHQFFHLQMPVLKIYFACYNNTCKEVFTYISFNTFQKKLAVYGLDPKPIDVRKSSVGFASGLKCMEKLMTVPVKTNLKERLIFAG